MDTLSIAETMERELDRLRTARPRLASRIERAEHILVTQMSVSNGSRPIKVRIGAGGSRFYTVRSGSKFSRSYTVNLTDLSCECPDHRKRQAACKHEIACWVLNQVLTA